MTVLLLTVVMRVLEPEVTVLTTAEVETAVPLPELPVPPAAP